MSDIISIQDDVVSIVIQDDDDSTVSVYDGVAPNAGGDHNHDERYYTEAETDTLLASKAATVHVHDDRYFTETETTALLATKANTSHSHVIADTTGLQTALDSKQPTGDYATSTSLATKAPLSHTHVEADITNLGDYATSSELTAGLSTKAAVVHTHSIADVTNLQSSLNAKQASGDYATNTALTTGLSGKASTSHTHTEAEIIDLGDYIESVNIADINATGTPNDTSFLRGDGTWSTPESGESGGVTDHGALTGLTDDDHTQYHTDARGDARYYVKSEVTAYLASKSDASHAHTASSITDFSTAVAATPSVTANSAKNSYPSADATKLAGIATGATANSSDETLLARANHTGSQAQSTITNLISDLAAKQATLVSGTNIKTINGSTLLGSGDITISGGSGSGDTGYTVLASSYSPAANGTTDDTTPLQNALNALDTLGYGALDLEGKTYATGKLSLKPNTGIINGTLKLKNSANDYIISLDGHATRYQANWFIENVNFDCNSANNATTAGAIYCYANGTIYDRPRIENVKITNVRSTAINFTGNGTTMTIQPRLLFVTIDGPTAITNSKGISLSSKVYDPSFISVDVGRMHTGIDVDGAAKIRFTDVRAWGNESVGLKLTNVVDFAGVNCEFDKNFGHGVYTYDSSRIHFVGTAFSNNSYDDTSNEFGLGAGHGTTQTYDGIVGDGASEIFISACRMGNEATNYQRYGVSSQGTTTIYIDGTSKYFNNGWGTTTGNVKSGQQINRLELNNDSAIDPQTSTRTNLGFASNTGAGFELYKYSDGTKPGKFAAIYGGAPSQGTVGFTHFDGTNYTDRFSLDASGNLTLGGAITSGGVAVPTISSTSTLTNKTLTTPTVTTLTIKDAVDATKVGVFAVSVATGTTRTYTLPDSTGTIVLTGNTGTLSNKAISLGSNTVSGTLAQFNTAVSDADLVSIAGTETLTNKTLTAPVINNPSGFLTGAAKITVGTSTPGSPTTGDLWIDTN
jgi:hypothetical protein